MRPVLVYGHANAAIGRARRLLEHAGLKTVTGLHSPGLLAAMLEREPEAGFVLVYASPQAALADALRGAVATAEAVDRLLLDWLGCNDELLRFYNRHVERCVLVSADKLTGSPSKFVSHVAQVLGLPLLQGAVDDVPTEDIADEADADVIAQFLARALIEGRKDARALLLELDSQTSLDAADIAADNDEPARAWRQFVQLVAIRTQALAADARWNAEIATAEAAARQQARLALEHAGQIAALTDENEDLRQQLERKQQALQTLEALLREQSAAEVNAAAERAAQIAQQADQRQAQLVQAMSERDWHAAQAAPLKAQLAEITQENELLLLQLHQVQEELEHHYMRHRQIASQVADETPMLAFLRHRWRALQPDEMVLDLRDPVPSSNWHQIEADGRWAGPGLVSELRFPALRPGLYSVQLDIVDAMQADIVTGMEVHLNGTLLNTEALIDGYPALVHGTVSVHPDAGETSTLELRFPRVIAPRDRGEQDDRPLALRLRAVTLTWLEPV